LPDQAGEELDGELVVGRRLRDRAADVLAGRRLRSRRRVGGRGASAIFWLSGNLCGAYCCAQKHDDARSRSAHAHPLFDGRRAAIGLGRKGFVAISSPWPWRLPREPYLPSSSTDGGRRVLRISLSAWPPLKSVACPDQGRGIRARRPRIAL